MMWISSSLLDLFILMQVLSALELFTLTHILIYSELHRKQFVAFTLEAPCVNPLTNNVCADLLQRVVSAT